MDFRRLEVFSKVYELRSFSGAGKGSLFCLAVPLLRICAFSNFAASPFVGSASPDIFIWSPIRSVLDPRWGKPLWIFSQTTGASKSKTRNQYESSHISNPHSVIPMPHAPCSLQSRTVLRPLLPAAHCLLPAATCPLIRSAFPNPTSLQPTST